MANETTVTVTLVGDETRAVDLTKYAGVDDPCPFCGTDEAIDSTDDDSGPYGDNGQCEMHEKWSCGACGASWDAVFAFQRLVMHRAPDAEMLLTARDEGA